MAFIVSPVSTSWSPDFEGMDGRHRLLPSCLAEDLPGRPRCCQRTRPRYDWLRPLHDRSLRPWYVPTNCSQAAKYTDMFPRISDIIQLVSFLKQDEELNRREDERERILDPADDRTHTQSNWSLAIPLNNCRTDSVRVKIAGRKLIIHADLFTTDGHGVTRYGRVRRAETLPEHVDADRVKARYTRGHLVVTAPGTASTEPDNQSDDNDPENDATITAPSMTEPDSRLNDTNQDGLRTPAPRMTGPDNQTADTDHDVDQGEDRSSSSSTDQFEIIKMSDEAGSDEHQNEDDEDDIVIQSLESLSINGDNETSDADNQELTDDNKNTPPSGTGIVACTTADTFSGQPSRESHQNETSDDKSTPNEQQHGDGGTEDKRGSGLSDVTSSKSSEQSGEPLAIQTVSGEHAMSRVSPDDQFVFDMSTYSPEDVKVSINEKTVTVSADVTRQDGDVRCHFRSMNSIVLHNNADVDKVTCSMTDDGKLTVHAPRRQNTDDETIKSSLDRVNN